MKPISKPLLMLLLCLTSAVSFSQVAKTAVFGQFPESLSISKSELGLALNAAEGSWITLKFSTNLTISGKVVTNIQKYDNLQSMLIKTEGYANAFVHLSKITNKDNSISYVGTILSDDALDGLEIKEDAAGNYQLNKLQTETVLQPCAKF